MFHTRRQAAGRAAGARVLELIGFPGVFLSSQAQGRPTARVSQRGSRSGGLTRGPAPPLSGLASLKPHSRRGLERLCSPRVPMPRPAELGRNFTASVQAQPVGGT